jgi:hypothetical protein
MDGMATGGGLDRGLRLTFWGAAAALLLAPAVAMRFTAQVDWGAEDFLFAGALLGLAGLALEATLRLSRSWPYRLGAGFAVAAAFLILWADAAVGMIGDGGNLYGLLFKGAIGLALAGAVAVRFRASGMAGVMLLAGIVHLCAGLAGIAVDPLGGAYSAGFAGLWFVSAACFRRAARG